MPCPFGHVCIAPLEPHASRSAAPKAHSCAGLLGCQHRPGSTDIDTASTGIGCSVVVTRQILQVQHLHATHLQAEAARRMAAEGAGSLVLARRMTLLLAMAPKAL